LVMDGTLLHAAEQRRLEWESKQLPPVSEPDSDRRSGEVVRGKQESQMEWIRLAYEGLFTEDVTQEKAA
jgi:hypothetical protein